MKKSNIFKNLLTVMLALIVAFGSCIPAFATTTRTDWNGHKRFKVDGNDAYCIDFSAVSGSSGSVNSKAYTKFSSLSSGNQQNIKYAIAAAHRLGYYNSDDEKYFAVQYYIWMHSCKDAANAGLSSWFKTTINTYYENFCAEIDKIKVSAVTPSFSPQSLTLTKDNLSGIIKDENKKLKDYWSLQPYDKDKFLTLEKDNNSIKVSTTDGALQELGAGVSQTYKFTYKCNINYYTIDSSNCYMFGNQAVVYTADTKRITKSVEVSLQGYDDVPDLIQDPKPTLPEHSYGKICVQKYLSCGGSLFPQSNVIFYIYKEGIDGEFEGTPMAFLVTDANGYGEISNMELGYYKVIEAATANAHPKSFNSVFYVKVEENSNAYIKSPGLDYVENVVEAGDFCVHKVVSDVDENGSIINDSFSAGKNGTSAQGFTFNLSGLSYSGGYVNINSVTDEFGNAYFCNIPVGEFTLQEVNTNTSSYIYGGSQNAQQVSIYWDGQESYANYFTTNSADFQSTKFENGTGSGNYSYVNETGYEVYIQNEDNCTIDNTNASTLNFDYSLFSETKKLENIITDNLNGKDFLYIYYTDGNVVYEKSNNTNTVIINKSYYELKNEAEYEIEEETELPVSTGIDYNETISDLMSTLGVNSLRFTDVIVTLDSNKNVSVSLLSTNIDDYEYDETLTNSVDNYTKSQQYFNYVNVVKSFMAEFQKVDNETGLSKAQGDATLEGAVYGLYRTYKDETKLVGTYVTDANGMFTTSPHVIYGKYTIKELQASKGYNIDPNSYVIFDELTADTNDWGKITTITVNAKGETLTLPEEVEKAPLYIYKTTAYSDNLAEQVAEENAKFEVYLKANGSYDDSPEYERDLVTTDENGFAKTKDLPYGTYTIHQIAKGDKNSIFCNDVDVSTYLNNTATLVNLKYKAYVNVTKKDADTGKTIKVSGATFRIYKADNEGNFSSDEEQLVSYRVTTPTPHYIYDFYTDETGTVTTPASLECGKYYLVETKAPKGYKLDSTPVPFEVTLDNQKDLDIAGAKIKVVYTSKTDTVQKGRISLYKYGNVFDTVETSPEGFTIPVFKEGYLEDVSFKIVAQRNIYSADGTLRVKKGEVVDTITTDNTGVAISDYLFIDALSDEPEYALIETKAPYGFVLNEEPTFVNLSFDEENSLLELDAKDTSVNVKNERQTCTITLTKQMEKDTVYNIGNNNEVENVYFGLYASEDIIARDGSTIKAGDLISASYVDSLKSDEADGSLTFKTDIPMGYSYYIQEISTNNYYKTIDNQFEFKFDIDNREDTTVNYKINDGKVIKNELARTTIIGTKCDVDGKLVEGAVYGLFDSNATDFTLDTAITTVKTDVNGNAIFEFVPKGDYIISEISAPAPYTVSDEKVKVSVTGDSEKVTFNVTDEFIKGNIALYKYDADYPDNLLTGACFEVYEDKNSNGVYDKEIDVFYAQLKETQTGYYALEGLRYGMYLVKEITAPEGFAVDENYYSVTITENNHTYNVTNNGTCFINKTLVGSLKIIKESSNDVVEGFTFNIKGTSISGHSIDITEVTNSNGEIIISNIPTGIYTVSEIETDATLNYILEPSKEVTITADSETVIDFYNEYIEEIEDDEQDFEETTNGSKTGTNNIGFILSIFGIFFSVTGIVICILFLKKKFPASKNNL